MAKERMTKAKGRGKSRQNHGAKCSDLVHGFKSNTIGGRPNFGTVATPADVAAYRAARDNKNQAKGKHP